MKRTARNRVMYYNDGAKRDLDGHIWVAVIVIVVAILAHFLMGWGGVLAVLVLAIAGLLLTMVTRLGSPDPQSPGDLTEAERDRVELDAEKVQYMGTNGFGCLVAIAIVLCAMVILMLIFFIGNQHIDV